MRTAHILGRMEAISRAAESAKPHLLRKGTVPIDLGCGTAFFAEAVEIRSIVGLDFSSVFLPFARERMKTVFHQSIFDFQLKKSSVDNIISLFVIDDHPSEKKRIFFKHVLSSLKPSGRFFFSACSPNDERMGKLREVVNKK